MRDLFSLTAEAAAELKNGDQLVGVVNKAVDFRAYTAVQAVTSLDTDGNTILIFIRNEPGVIQQTYTLLNVSEGEMQVSETHIPPLQTQACHVAMNITQSTQFAAQLLALALSERPDVAKKALAGANLRIVSND